LQAISHVRHRHTGGQIFIFRLLTCLAACASTARAVRRRRGATGRRASPQHPPIAPSEAARGAGGGAPPPSELVTPAPPAAPPCRSGGAWEPASRPAAAPGAPFEAAHWAGKGSPLPSEMASPAPLAVPSCRSGGAGEPASRPAGAPGASRSRLPAKSGSGRDSGGVGFTTMGSAESPPAIASTNGKCAGSGNGGRLVVGAVPSGGGVPGAGRAPNGGRSPHHSPTSQGSGEPRRFAHSRLWSSPPGSAAAMASSGVCGLEVGTEAGTPALTGGGEGADALALQLLLRSWVGRCRHMCRRCGAPGRSRHPWQREMQRMPVGLPQHRSVDTPQ